MRDWALFIANASDRKDAYAKYRRSSEWKDTRAAVMARANHTCEKGGCTVAAIHVHHRTYENVGNEPLQDLQALCGECHQKAHRSVRAADTDFSTTELAALVDKMKSEVAEIQKKRDACIRGPLSVADPYQQVHELAMVEYGELGDYARMHFKWNALAYEQQWAERRCHRYRRAHQILAVINA